MREMVEGKSVAVVGSAPGVFSNRNGYWIDQHDVVIRVNLLDNIGREEFLGARTDVRFVGCTLVDKHVEYVRRVGFKGVVITTRKNKEFLSSVGKEGILFPEEFPRWTFKRVMDKCGSGKLPVIPEKPPKSGIVCLGALVAFGMPRSITVFGFSRDEVSAWSAIHYSDSDGQRVYNRDYILSKHCDPVYEVALLELMERDGVVKIV
ncbi:MULTISPECIES: glycosyltransferase family 29 protein [unclassified Thioalkalivibrio]|uniref:glycosyltransferase family 29 protein n=1 Tax=unclassified Thioalkalivibrio TaxID=2621013 RepID=UPI0012DF1A77|nr:MULTISPECIES: glycosyltransferase family 29 protein [unclassified Thioalkalivibrio]